MKILFVWRKIDRVSGGVERMSAAMMNGMIARGHEVSFLSWDHEDAVAYYDLDENITWYKLGIGDPNVRGSWKTRFQRMAKVREIVKQDNPDVIFCFESGVFFSTKMFLLGFDIPMISAERNAPSRHQHSSNPSNRFKVYLMLMLADKITVQFERYRDGYPFFLRHKIVVIHNPVYPIGVNADPMEEEEKTLLCVARLSYQKNIQILIEAFSSLSKKFPDWTLKIAGDGEEEDILKEMVLKYNAKDKIEFLGAVEDVKSLYASAQLFCLPSRYEGFPNALAEAFSSGLPAVGFDKCCGVRDLIQDHVTGRLAEGNGDPHSFANALEELMSDAQKRALMGKNAKKSMALYDPPLVFNQLEDLFKTIIKIKS